ncbi:unnamed protein product [Auanema sp. JU1783]|nr:unnamed protein product [Auanema sp. JU1783]
MALMAYSRSRSLQILFFLLIGYSCSCSYLVYVNPYHPENPSDLDISLLTTMSKRGKSVLTGLSAPEDVCTMRMIYNHEPSHGHMSNGSWVEIQQDQEFNLKATYVECLSEDRPPCYGIDRKRFTSECFTVFDYRPASVRLFGSLSPYVKATVRIPISCQCQVRAIGTLFR